MSWLDTSTAAFQLKSVYGNKVEDLFKRQAMTYNLFMKSNRIANIRPGGAGYVFAVRQAANEAVGARIQGGSLPEPIPGEGVQGTIVPKLIYAQTRLSGLLMEAGKGNTAAFVDATADAVMDSYKSIISDLNRQCHGDGYGLLGTLSAAATCQTDTTWTVTMDNDRGTRYLRKGMIVDFYESGAIDEDTVSSRISSINRATKVVTMEKNAGTYKALHPIVAARDYSLDDAQTVASGAEMVRYGAREVSHATTDTHRECMGLLGMYDDSTLIAQFEGITCTAGNDIEFQANVMGNSDVNREVTIDLMLAACDMTAGRSDTQPDIIRMGLGQRRKYFGLMAPDVRYSPLQLTGGYEKLGFSQNGAISIIVDPYTQPNRMFFEPSGAIKKYELKPLGWGGFDPNKMHWRDGYDEASMYLSVYTNLGVEARNGLTVLEDLTEPSSMPF
jgi:hypothetical protein